MHGMNIKIVYIKYGIGNSRRVVEGELNPECHYVII
jgi:hypothetical protein